MPKNAEQGDTLLEERQKEREEVKEPPMYKVILLNDDYTPFEFVVDVLVRFFQMNGEKAVKTMLTAHRDGSATCGIYPKDIAETRCQQVASYASAHEFPLRCDMEAND
jgi:ATP-dependent Clp protease adaptor protein ClpS